jgi:hypothetical protein
LAHIGWDKTREDQIDTLNNIENLLLYKIGILKNFRLKLYENKIMNEKGMESLKKLLQVDDACFLNTKLHGYYSDKFLKGDMNKI